ncbi:MAG: hypothetical protein FWD12_11905 [Alphaproteobacteria bacterium]|nr:hypothetical protein [Alphaproteobacteria bacterium]
MIEERAYLVVKEKGPDIRVRARTEHDLRGGSRDSNRRGWTQSLHPATRIRRFKTQLESIEQIDLSPPLSSTFPNEA